MDNTIDPTIKKLVQSIGRAETGDSADAYNARGKAGEIGRYQFMPKTWKAWAGQHLGDENAPMSVENQNRVAYETVKAWKAEGLTPAQIASRWNSGDENKYKQNWRKVDPETGEVIYDTPAYAMKVSKYYREASGMPTITTPEASITTPEAPKSFRYSITPTAETRAAKLRKATEEAEKSRLEAEDANSFTGMLKNFGKAFVENIAGSEVGLGKTISEIAFNPMEYADNIQTMTNTNIKLQKLIKDRDERGVDTSGLKQAYNNNLDLIDEWKAEIQQHLENLPKTSKVVGQLAGTTLDLLTAGTYGKAKALMTSGKLATKSPVIKGAVSAISPELGKISEQAAGGLFTKKGAINIAKGAGIGYSYDISQGLQGFRGEDREGAAAVVPGIGTLLGASIPFISETTQSIKNVTNKNLRASLLATKRQKELSKLDSYQTLKKAILKGESRGIDVKEIVSKTDVLHGSVDNTGTIHTLGEDGAVANYTKEFIDGNESIVSDLLKKEGRSISANLVKKKMIENIENAGIEGAALTKALNSVDDEVAGLLRRSKAEGTIPVATLHNAKVDKYNSINFFTEGNTKKLDKTIARTYRELVEKNTTSVDVADINKELSKHFAVIDYLKKLDNKKVEGGKLGKYFASTVGAIVGHGVAGPLGGIIGAESGARVKGGLMEKTFKGKTGIKQPQSKVITEAQKVLKEEPLQLQSSKSLGNLKTNQSTTITKIKKGISPIIKENKKKVNLPEIIYRGQSTPNKITRNIDNMNEPFHDIFPNSTFATNDIEYAKQYGQHIINIKTKGQKFINLDNPITPFEKDIASKINSYINDEIELTLKEGKEITKKLEDNGYVGIQRIYDDTTNTVEYIYTNNKK